MPHTANAVTRARVSGRQNTNRQISIGTTLTTVYRILQSMADTGNPEYVNAWWQDKGEGQDVAQCETAEDGAYLAEALRCLVHLDRRQP